MPKLKFKLPLAPEIDMQCQNCKELYIKRLSPDRCPRCSYPEPPEGP